MSRSLETEKGLDKIINRGVVSKFWHVEDSAVFSCEE